MNKTSKLIVSLVLFCTGLSEGVQYPADTQLNNMDGTAHGTLADRFPDAVTTKDDGQNYIDLPMILNGKDKSLLMPIGKIEIIGSAVCRACIVDRVLEAEEVHSTVLHVVKVPIILDIESVEYMLPELMMQIRDLPQYKMHLLVNTESISVSDLLDSLDPAAEAILDGMAEEVHNKFAEEMAKFNFPTWLNERAIQQSAGLKQHRKIGGLFLMLIVNFLSDFLESTEPIDAELLRHLQSEGIDTKQVRDAELLQVLLQLSGMGIENEILWLNNHVSSGPNDLLREFQPDPEVLHEVLQADLIRLMITYIETSSMPKLQSLTPEQVEEAVSLMYGDIIDNPDILADLVNTGRPWISIPDILDFTYSKLVAPEDMALRYRL